MGKIPELAPGTVLTAEHLNAIARELNRVSNLTVAPPMELYSNAGGNMLRLSGDFNEHLSQFSDATGQTFTADAAVTRFAMDSTAENVGANTYNSLVTLNTSGDVGMMQTTVDGTFLVWFRFEVIVARTNDATVTAASVASPIVLSVTSGHGFVAGDAIRVTQLSGTNYNADGYQIVSAVTSTTITLGNTTGIGTTSFTGKLVLCPDHPGTFSLGLRKKSSGGSFTSIPAGTGVYTFSDSSGNQIGSQQINAVVLLPIQVDALTTDEFELVGDVNGEDASIASPGAEFSSTSGICSWLYLGQ